MSVYRNSVAVPRTASLRVSFAGATLRVSVQNGRSAEGYVPGRSRSESLAPPYFTPWLCQIPIPMLLTRPAITQLPLP